MATCTSFFKLYIVGAVVEIVSSQRKNGLSVVAVVGGQWGDEGKGKLIDLLAQKADLVIRAQGGDNAGHTVINQGKKTALHIVPSGILNPEVVNYIGPGVALNPFSLMKELYLLEMDRVDTKNLYISRQAQLILPYHVREDLQAEEKRGNSRIGTTGKGIGPSYTDRARRVGIQAGDLDNLYNFEASLSRVLNEKALTLQDLSEVFDNYYEWSDRLAGRLVDSNDFLTQFYQKDASILIEGAQGTLLDVSLGTYPYVTSSSCTVAGVLAGAGIPPSLLTKSYGVYKAYQTRVGSGAMPTRIQDETESAELRDAGGEFGTTTGRPREVGWFDGEAAKYSQRVNGFSKINLTKLDVLDYLDKIPVGVGYTLDGKDKRTFPYNNQQLERCRPIYDVLPGWREDISQIDRFDDLPDQAQKYVEKLQQLIGSPVEIIGVGPERKQNIFRP